MDTTVDRPDSLTPGAASGTALATPPRRRKATRPTGPPAEQGAANPIADPDETQVSLQPSDTKQNRGLRNRILRTHRPRLELGCSSFRIAWVAVAVVALAAATTVAALAWRQHQQMTDEAQQQAAIVDTAKQGITALINIRGDNAAADLNRLNELTTAPFSDELHNQSANYVKAIHDADVLSTGQVIAAGIATDDGTARGSEGTTVIVAADAQVTDPQSHQQQRRSYRFSVTVKQVHGVRKVSDVEFVP